MLQLNAWIIDALQAALFSRGREFMPLWLIGLFIANVHANPESRIMMLKFGHRASLKVEGKLRRLGVSG
jgi:hypothetical protein